MFDKTILSKCLGYYPFEGDFGEPGDKILRDEVVEAGKNHVHGCHICGADIWVDIPHRVMAVKWVDGFRQYRWCYYCCVAMFLYCVGDEGHALHQVYANRS